MQISTLLHPEVVLGKRGTKIKPTFYMDCIKALMKMLSDEPLDTSEQELYDNFKHDEFFLKHIKMCTNYIQYKFPIYYVPKGFGHAIQRLDRDIDLSLFANMKFQGYFQFADNTLGDDLDWLTGCYVIIATAKEMLTKHLAGFHVEDDNQPVIWLDWVYKNYQIGDLCLPIRPGMLKNAYADIPHEIRTFGERRNCTETENQADQQVLRAILNLILYTTASNKEIEYLKPSIEMKKSEKKEVQKRNGTLNMCTLPMTLLTWNFHDDVSNRNYVAGEWPRIGHYRWQRHGTGLTQIKLIWIQETTCTRARSL